MVVTDPPGRRVCAGLYDSAAALLSYPGPGLEAAVAAARGELAGAPAEAAHLLAEFLERIQGLAPTEREEIYTRTFDLNPVCALEVGWHLYGEAYERGAFLARMRELLAGIGLAESIELPDHLTAALPALARLSPGDAASFSRSYLLPAIDKMLAGLAGQENPYENLLRAVRVLAAEEAR